MLASPESVYAAQEILEDIITFTKKSTFFTVQSHYMQIFERKFFL